MLNREEWIHVDVITCAAPYRPGLKKVDDNELKRIFKSRIKNIIEASLYNDIEVLVLGAFGCGAFSNPPEIVSESFKEVIDEFNYSDKIPYIIFAIKKSNNKNYRVFNDCFETNVKDPKKSKHSRKKKKELNFQSVDSLQQVVNVVNDSALALNDKKRTIRESPLSEILLGSLGAGIGGAGSFVALYGLGTVGLSASGIMSGLAAAGGGVYTLLGGAVSASVAGIFVLAAPVAILAGSGVALGSFLKNKQVRQERIRLYKEALAKHQAIIEELKKENQENRDRLDYLQSLNILLTRALKDLKEDIETVGDSEEIAGIA